MASSLITNLTTPPDPTEGAGVPDPHPHFPVGTLHPPLTSAQRTELRAYLIAHGLKDSDIDQYETDSAHSKDPTQAQVDAALIQLYELYISGGRYKSDGKAKKEFDPSGIPGVATVEDIYAAITNGNTWIRVAEFAVGAVLLGVGLNAFTKGGAGNAASSGSSVGKKAVKFATPKPIKSFTGSKPLKAQAYRSGNTSHRPATKATLPKVLK